MNKIDMNRAASQSQRKSVEGTVARLSETFKRSEAHRKRLIENARQLKQQRDQAASELEAANAELTQVKGKLEEMEQDAADALEEMRSSHNAQIVANQAYNSDLVSRVKALSDEVKSRDAQIADLNRQVEDANAKVAEASELKGRLNETIMSIQADADRKVETSDTRARELGDRLARHQRDLSRKLDAQNRGHKAEMDKLTADHELREKALRDELTQERARTSDAEERIQYATNENERLCALLASLQGQVEGFFSHSSDFDDFDDIDTTFEVEDEVEMVTKKTAVPELDAGRNVSSKKEQRYVERANGA